MTDDAAETPTPPAARPVSRDITSAVLTVGGIVGLLILAFVLDPMLGVAGVCGLAVAAGLILGVER